MSDKHVVESIQDKYDSLKPYLNEKTRRIWAAIEARSLGWGGISQVAGDRFQRAVTPSQLDYPGLQSMLGYGYC